MKAEVANALRVLQAEGFSLRMLPDAIELQIGRVSITHPGPGPCSSTRIKITIDGNEIQNMLREIEVRAAVEEAVSMKIVLGGFA